MKQLILALGIVLIGFSCTKDFEQINENPNQPASVSGDLLLRTSIFDLTNLLVSETYGFTDILAQYMAIYEYNQLDIYNWTADARFWWMYGTLQNIKDVKAYGVKQKLPNYEAVAIILETYSYSVLTDAYGDVPFSQSNKAESEGIISPAYDTQESIYPQLLANLKRANDIIDLDGSISGDILYNGDMLLWKKFANSLRARLLMRISKVRDVAQDLQAIVDDPSQYPVFESASEGAIYHYSGVTPDISPYSSGLAREYEYFLGVPTTHFVQVLLQNNDPRIHEWLGYHTKDDGTLEYLGLAPGQNQGDIGRPVDYSSKDTSYFSESDKITGIFMTHSELCFVLAEAAAKNIINADAKTWYEQGVSSSFEQWGVEMPGDFLTQSVPYDANNLDRLYEQKWLALYHSGIEAWFDWKRTGKPAFIQAGPGNVNNGLVPVRLQYPSLEQSVNASNYQTAAQRIGGDNINARVWWDK